MAAATDNSAEIDLYADNFEEEFPGVSHWLRILHEIKRFPKLFSQGIHYFLKTKDTKHAYLCFCLL